MKFRMEDQGDVLRVALEGQLNFTANEDFQSLLGDLLRFSGRTIVLDLTNVAHIDSVGLGLLYIAKEDLEAVGCRLGLACPGEAVSRLLEITEAYKSFDIVR